MEEEEEVVIVELIVTVITSTGVDAMSCEVDLHRNFGKGKKVDVSKVDIE